MVIVSWSKHLLDMHNSVEKKKGEIKILFLFFSRNISNLGRKVSCCIESWTEMETVNYNTLKV